MRTLGPLLLLNTTAVERLPFKVRFILDYSDHLFCLLTLYFSVLSTFDLFLSTHPFTLFVVLQSWLRSSLSDLMGSLPMQPMGVPKDFRFWFDLSALRRKLFDLQTAGSLPSRRKRQGVCV